MYEIVEKYQDGAGKWCVRAAVSPEESMFLWYETEPTQEEVDASVDRYLAARIAEAERLALEQTIGE